MLHISTEKLEQDIFGVEINATNLYTLPFTKLKKDLYELISTS